MIANKITRLSRCDSHFLSDLAKETSLSFRNYKEKDRSSLLKTLSHRFDYETVDRIVKMYLLCLDAKDVANMVKTNGMQGIIEAIPDFFGSKEYFYEVSLGKRICDLVFIKDKEVIAIEVKSASDKVSRSIEQVDYYKLWADRVYLAFDIKHRKKVQELSLYDKGIGLLEYADGKLRTQCEAQLTIPESGVRLGFLTYKYLRVLARSLGIKPKGSKKEILKKLGENISKENAQQIFINFLMNKLTNQDKATKQSVEIARTYPLKQFLT